MIVELFGGPGGWAEGLRSLGRSGVAIEWDAAACATRAAAGHPTIRGDVAAAPCAHLAGRVEGLIGSPPCPQFSASGRGAGRRIMAELRHGLLDALRGADTLAEHRAAMAYVLADSWPNPEGDLSAQDIHDLAGDAAAEAALTVEPARWIAATRPRWVALEQVPAVLPLWSFYSRCLAGMGYSAWAGILNAADYGVPQTRRRAILVASRDRTVTAPEPTHCRGGASTLFGDLAPWVSMAAALGWTGEVPARVVGFPRRDDRGDSEDGYRERDWHPGDGPAPVITEKARSMMVLNMAAQPAPTVTTEAGAQWQLRPGIVEGRNRRTYGPDEPAPTIHFGHDAASWVFDRPATTVMGAPTVWPPGHKYNGDLIARLGEDEARRRYGDRAGTDAIRLTIEDALVLQGFDPGYPVQGSRTKQFEQVGNAVPPPLAAAVLRAVL